MNPNGLVLTGGMHATVALDEMEGISEEVAREALTLAAAKLPVMTKIVMRTVM